MILKGREKELCQLDTSKEGQKEKPTNPRQQIKIHKLDAFLTSLILKQRADFVFFIYILKRCIDILGDRTNNSSNNKKRE